MIVIYQTLKIMQNEKTSLKFEEIEKNTDIEEMVSGRNLHIMN